MPAPTRYPLAWPPEKTRTPVGERRHSQFGKREWSKMLRELAREVDLLGGSEMLVSSNQPVRNDGLPYAQERTIIDPGVAVYFTLEGMPVRFACDQWLTLSENVRAITLHLESMRGQERWGVGTRRQAFSGYTSLTRTSVEDWRIALRLRPTGSFTRDDIQQAYRELVKDVHPDRGGTPEAMTKLNEARDRALKEVR